GVAERAVTADGDHGGAQPRGLVGDPTQGAQLRRSDAPPVVAIEDEHDDLALEVGQRRPPARARRQGAPRSRRPEAGPGHEWPAVRRRLGVVTQGFMVAFFRYTTVDTRAGKARYR